MSISFEKKLLHSALRSTFLFAEFYLAVQCEYECEKRGGGSVVERLPHMLEIEARFSDATDLKSDSSTAKDLNFTNLIKISPFISLFVCFLSLVKGSNTTPFKTRSGDLMTCSRLTNQNFSCECFGAVGM